MNGSNRELKEIVAAGANMLPAEANQALEFLRAIIYRHEEDSEIAIAEEAFEVLLDAVASAWAMAHGFKRSSDAYIQKYSEIVEALKDPDGIEHPLVDEALSGARIEALMLHYECNSKHIASVLFHQFGWDAEPSARLAYLLDNFETAVTKRGAELLPVLRELVRELELEHGED